METSLSIRAYAAHRKAMGLPGGSKYAVERAIKSKRISRNHRGKINPAVADIEWAANTAYNGRHIAAWLAEHRPERELARVLEQLIPVIVDRVAAAVASGTGIDSVRGALAQEITQAIRSTWPAQQG